VPNTLVYSIKKRNTANSTNSVRLFISYIKMKMNTTKNNPMMLKFLVEFFHMLKSAPIGP
jgi:hypothetical protein